MGEYRKYIKNKTIIPIDYLKKLWAEDSISIKEIDGIDLIENTVGDYFNFNIYLTDNDDWEIYLWSLRSKHLYRGVLKEFEDFTNMETVMIRYSLGEVRCNGCGEWVDLHQVDRVRYGTFCRESEECEEKYREALEYDKLRG